MYKILEHEADLGVLGIGESWAEAFAEGAKGMFSVMADVERVKPAHEVQMEASAGDTAALFVEMLNELIFLRDTEEMLFSKFEFRIDGGQLAGSAWGEKIDQERHGVKIEVKAATYSGMRAWEEGGKKHVQCILDV